MGMHMEMSLESLLQELDEDVEELASAHKSHLLRVAVLKADLQRLRVIIDSLRDNV